MSGNPLSQSAKNIYFCTLKIKNMAALINFGEHLPITNPTWIFFLVLCIILFAPILLNKLKIPHLIGMILAGILIGEHGFNLLARDSSFELFGQVGLFYIMFLAGLEMNMEDFHAIRWKAIVFGILAFIIPLVLGFFSNIFVLEYGVVSSILLASMYASHTLISYPIVTRYGVARHRCVSIAVGATAITDSLTLLVLAIIGSMYKGEAAGSWSWLELILKFLLAGVFIAYSFPRIGRWFLRKYEDGIVQFIFILAMVFLAAGLMELVGMEGILGAFFAGLVLNRLIPTVSPLRNYLEFVGNALFIPYFLIGVGMIIDMKVFFGHIESMKVAGVMTVMALGTKWIAAWATQKIYGMKKIERQLMFGLSNAQAAATLAAVLVGYSIILPDGSRLLNEDVLNGTIVLILVTCIISSITTDIAARKMALSELPPDSSKSRVDNEKILISFSNQQNVKNLIYLALLVSNPKKNNGLVGLHVMYDNCTEEDRQRGKILLRQAQEIAAKADATLQTQNRLATNLSNGILHASKENDVSEIIVGLHIRATQDESFFGPVLLNLLNKMDRQIMILHAITPIDRVRNIHVAIPKNAEYEAGFYRWLERIARMGQNTNSRIFWHGHPQTLSLIQSYLQHYHTGVVREMCETDGGNELKRLSAIMQPDDLMVIIMARHGSVSFRPSLEHVPHQINAYYTEKNFILLFPDSYARTSSELTFVELHGTRGTYEKKKRWFDFLWEKKG